MTKHVNEGAYIPFKLIRHLKQSEILSLLCEKKPLGLAWFFCGQKKGESLESCPPLPDVDYLERKE